MFDKIRRPCELWAYLFWTENTSLWIFCLSNKSILPPPPTTASHWFFSLFCFFFSFQLPWIICHCFQKWPQEANSSGMEPCNIIDNILKTSAADTKLRLRSMQTTLFLVGGVEVGAKMMAQKSPSQWEAGLKHVLMASLENRKSCLTAHRHTIKVSLEVL